MEGVGALITKTVPKVIETEEENGRMVVEAERLMDRGDRRTPEEDALLTLLVSLIQAYEQQHYPIREASPHEVLRYLMEKRELKQVDLLPIFKSSGYISDVINGKRGSARRTPGSWRRSSGCLRSCSSEGGSSLILQVCDHPLIHSTNWYDKDYYAQDSSRDPRGPVLGLSTGERPCVFPRQSRFEWPAKPLRVPVCVGSSLILLPHAGPWQPALTM